MTSNIVQTNSSGAASKITDSVRRVVTAVDESGRSRVHLDEMIPISGLGTMLWSSDPPKTAPWIADIPAHSVPPIEPAPAGSHAMIVRLEPDDGTSTPIEVPGVGPDGFHISRTVDYVLVLAGEVEAVLDLNTVTLRRGDMLIQQGTNHAWRNRAKNPAIFLVVLTSAIDR